MRILSKDLLIYRAEISRLPISFASLVKMDQFGPFITTSITDYSPEYFARLLVYSQRMQAASEAGATLSWWQFDN